MLGPLAPPPLWQERAAQPADVVVQLVAPPGSESARSFVYGARLFRRLLQFWGSLRWPALGASAVQEAVTWVELTLFFELAVGAELPYCVEGKTGSRPEHFRYAEDGAAYSPATVEQKAAVLASATWALEALVGEVLPSAARRGRGLAAVASYYTVGGLGAFGRAGRPAWRLSASPAAAPASRAGGVWHFARVSRCGRASERRSERSRVVDASLAGRRARWARKCRCGRARRRGAHCGVTWFGVAARLLRVVRGRGPWAVDWAYIHGFFCVVGSSDFEVTVGAALASSSRGSSWWLGARWLAVGGGTGRWRAAERTCVFIALWRRACCGAYPLFYRSSAF